jgi:CheY-like chemotaxis protein
LETVTIVLIEPEERCDYSFTTYPIEPESHPLSQEVSRIYGLNVVRYHSFNQACEYLSTKGTSNANDHIAILIHENLYPQEADTKLNALVGIGSYTVMTHGPNYLVESTKKRHFKSLSRIFPVTLLNSIASHVLAHISEMEASDIDIAAPTGVLDPLSSHCPDASQVTQSTLNPAPRSAVSVDELVSSKLETKRLPRRYNLKVLYAEDNLVNQKVLSRVLNRAGISDITIVDDGQKAVDLASSSHFDCIFMDMQMPIMDGMEATRIIMERDPSAKVIFVTAHALDEFKSRADSVGATSFISKPFRVSDIEKVLEETGICVFSSHDVSVDSRNFDSTSATMNALHSTVTTPDGPSNSDHKIEKKGKPLFEILSTSDDVPPIIPRPRDNQPRPNAGSSLFSLSQSMDNDNSAHAGTQTTAEINYDLSTEASNPPPPPQHGTFSISPKFGVTKSSSFKSNKDPLSSRHLKVLYAEDNPINQKVLTRVLNRTGITDITIVDNGQKAVDITKNILFDCIFMDMQMPFMDGMEATKLIMERDPESKIVFVTAHAMEEYKKKAEALGARSFLAKPVRVTDIEEVLKMLGL